MAELIRNLDPARIAENFERARARAGDGVEILVATKYVPLEEMGALAEAGVSLVGENRQQDLAAKRERWESAFEWDFIGALQSRKVRQLLPACRLIHSLASDSALAEVARRLLERAGVERVELAGLCTSCEKELFFSHRRDRGRTGRQAGLAWTEGSGGTWPS